MKKRTIHIVYPLPNKRDIFIRIERFLNLFSVNGLCYNNYDIYKWDKPKRAPHSITFNIIKSIKDNYKIKLYDFFDKSNIVLEEDDLFIGHASPDYSKPATIKNKWKEFDKDQVTNKVVLKYPNDKRVFLIGPFNFDYDQVGWLIPLLEITNNFIGICGDIWANDVEKVFPVFKNCKFHHVNMAVDSKQYPNVKKEFNKKGSRKFLYIGRISQEKGTNMLAEIAMKHTNFVCGYIGHGNIEGCFKIANNAILSPEFIKKLAQEYDFFINLSNFDAQATTVLEAMSWGFGVACTPETGYEHESFYTLSAKDLDFNLKMITTMQNVELEDIMLKQKHNYNLLKEKYSWEAFQNKILNIIKQNYDL